jgi:hypothetical protein
MLALQVHKAHKACKATLALQVHKAHKACKATLALQVRAVKHHSATISRSGE